MLAVGIGPIGPFEGLIILAIVVLIFGVGKLSDVGGALGKSIREFRKAAREDDEPSTVASSQSQATEAAHTSGRTCSNCGAGLESAAKFCNECGTAVQAAVN
jgi:sec-independent protein translocase protein TatA